jgi:hypothetical protein
VRGSCGGGGMVAMAGAASGQTMVPGGPLADAAQAGYAARAVDRAGSQQRREQACRVMHR